MTKQLCLPFCTLYILPTYLGNPMFFLISAYVVLVSFCKFHLVFLQSIIFYRSCLNVKVTSNNGFHRIMALKKAYIYILVREKVHFLFPMHRKIAANSLRLRRKIGNMLRRRVIRGQNVDEVRTLLMHWC